ncbi:hypothetical protein GCM10007140_16080 [Priestia taiwanensis]|uniref:Uncharacterized protein n=2 Tax=Priestia taiwanensis TaxID=1347902 RepID=A0A917AQI4_9BACI|nr:hypothetical protein GCM10007140_16080 [Priestia taiwanensis]
MQQAHSNYTVIKKSKMTGKQYSLSLTAGFWSGIILGIILYILEKVSGKKVYTLLMNVDFIPVLNSYLLPPWIEFSLHLIVSLLLSVGIQYLIVKRNTYRIMLITCVAVLPTILLYFPLSILATKEVARIDDISAFSYWSISHVIYALTLGYMLRHINKGHSTE